MAFEDYLLGQLRLEVRYMKVGDELYKILEEELTERKLWRKKQKPRGRAFPKGADNPVQKRWEKKQ